MDIQTAWVKPPNQIGGLDHLAVQAPCINIYGRMLPGITNVTDRARYYSFYPWIVWALELAGYRYNDAFIDQFRKADCLFTLIAHRHAHLAGTDHEEHAGATIGSANIAHQISDINNNQSVILSEIAHREDKPGRYFKNKLGGLGQYYLGVFAELGIMDGSGSSGVANTNQIGRVLAEAMDLGVDRSLFLQTLDENIVSAERLDQLASFCPCHLKNNPQEHQLLADLFFVRNLFAETDLLSRRRSLQLMLCLADELENFDQSIDLSAFRGAVYSGSLPNGAAWILPERLHQNRSRWAVYQRNELLSIAVQGIFFVLLDAYEESGLRFESSKQLCQWFLTTPDVAAIESNMPLDRSVADLAVSANDWLPPLNDWTHEHHEVQLANQIESLCDKKGAPNYRSTILQAALQILIALMKRPETHTGYEEFIFKGPYFDVYPINLKSFLFNCSQTWNRLSIKEWIAWLGHEWGVHTHFMVALRKLRGQSQSTFRIRPSDQGLEVISVPHAVFTSPRFNQSLRILKDIGALEKNGTVWTTSALGKQLKEVGDE